MQLYDVPKYVDEAVSVLAPFFKSKLSWVARRVLAIARLAHAPFISVRVHDSYSLTMAAKSLEPSPSAAQAL